MQLFVNLPDRMRKAASKLIQEALVSHDDHSDPDVIEPILALGEGALAIEELLRVMDELHRLLPADESPPEAVIIEPGKYYRVPRR